MNPLLWGMLLSLLPISELRGGIPYAVVSGINPISAFVFCTLANILVIPICFLFLETINKLLLKFQKYKNFFDLYLNSLRKRKVKIERNYETYGMVALTIFVAIPLPVTGAWTGTLIAWLLGLKKFRSFLAISLGVIIAGVLVTLIATGILATLNFLL